MSKGSPIIPTRIPTELLGEIDAAIERANRHRKGEALTRSSFLIAAVREKLAKMERSRKRRPRQAGQQTDQADS